MDLDTIRQKLLTRVVLKEPHPNQLMPSFEALWRLDWFDSIESIWVDFDHSQRRHKNNEFFHLPPLSAICQFMLFVGVNP